MVLCVICVALALIPLVGVVGYTIVRGAPVWSADFFTHAPTPEGIPGGGILNSIVGSLIIDGMAAAASIPLALAIGLYVSQSHSKIAAGIRFAADVMAGIPSIVVGIFAYGIIVNTMHHFSAIAGAFGIAVIMVPILVRASDGAFRTVPGDLGEAALALGAKRASIARRVLIPTAASGLFTAILLAVARGAGESAPLLFTAIGSQYFTASPMQPMAAMPLTIYLNGIQAYPTLQRIAWGTGLLLLLFILILSVAGRTASARLGRRA